MVEDQLWGREERVLKEPISAAGVLRAFKDAPLPNESGELFFFSALSITGPKEPWLQTQTSVT